MSENNAAGQFPERKLSCRIQAIEPLNHDVSRVMLEVPARDQLDWHAGQYLILELAPGDCPFSIAGAYHEGRQELELHIRHNEGNTSALQVMDELRGAEHVSLRGPGGERFINAREELPEQPVWFICGSTGFAPAKAMIETLLQRDFPREIRLYWGARSGRDLYLSSLAEHWAREGRIRYEPVLSEERTGNHRCGLVHEAVLEDLVDPAEPLFHVGGSPPMAWAVFDALRAAGVPGEHIHSDVFDYAPRDNEQAATGKQDKQ